MGCVGESYVGGNAHPPCKPIQACNPLIFFVGIMLTTCTPLCEFPPLILRRQRRKHLRRWRRKMFSHCRMIPSI